MDGGGAAIRGAAPPACRIYDKTANEYRMCAWGRLCLPLPCLCRCPALPRLHLTRCAPAWRDPVQGLDARRARRHVGHLLLLWGHF